MSGNVVIVNAGSKLGSLAASALEQAGWRVIALAGGTDSGWQTMLARLAARGEIIDALVTAPAGDGPNDESEATVATAWRGAKYALDLFAGLGHGTLLTLGFAPAKAGAAPGSDASAEAIRLMTAAALLDARDAGIRLRSNRLFCADELGSAAAQDAVAEAVRFLVDERSRFMTGSELTLVRSPLPVRADLAGQAFLVTGATSGIGRATAVEIARRGGWVGIGGRKPVPAQETLDMVRAAGGDGMVVTLDVTDPAGWRDAASAIGKARGALHGLVNNAGEALNRPIAALDSGQLGFLMEINCRAVQHGIEAMTGLLKAERGSILNIGSVAGMRAGPGGSAYSASKAAMIGLTRGHAARFSAEGAGIRANCLLPGFIWSDSVADSLGEEGARAFRAMIEPKTPLGRVGTPDDVASVIAYLLSDAAAGISGQTITVSGGLELNFP